MKVVEKNAALFFLQFTKNLSNKLVAAVVQSRLGEKVNAASQADTSAGTTWYNLAIKDIPEVLLYIYKSNVYV